MGKICCACKADVPLNLFSPDRRNPDGLQGRCRSCASAARRRAYSADPERYRKRQNDYYKSNTELVLAINKRSLSRNLEKVRARKAEAYQRDRERVLARATEYASKHKAEKRAYDRMYREMNADKLREMKAAWIAGNQALIKAVKLSYKARRRAAEKAGDSSRAIKDWIGRQQLVCRWCEADCRDNFHVDHIEPLSRGGAHAVSNLCIACPPCNLRKNARDPREFEAWIRSSRGMIGA